MNIIIENKEHVLEIKKSKFISLSFYVTSIKDVNIILKDILIKYPKATHYCYAYVINSLIKECDDGEPNGTAGSPIMSVISNNNLNFILIVVIRYYGGIKLGVGPLTRTYRMCANKVIENNIKPFIQLYTWNIKFEYSNIKKIDQLLNNIVTNKQFDNYITYSFDYPSDNIEDLIPPHLLLDYKIIKKD